MANEAWVTAVFGEVLVGPPPAPARVSAAFLEVMTTRSAPAIVTAAFLEVMALHLETVYQESLSDAVTATDAGTPGIRIAVASSNGVLIDETGLLERVVTISETDGVDVTDVTTELPQRFAVVSETVAVVAAPLVDMTWVPALAETLAIGSPVSVGFVAVASDAVSVTLAAQVARALTVIELLGLTDTLVPGVRLAMTVGDVVVLSDALRQFFALGVSDAVTLTPSIVPLHRISGSAADTITLTPTVTPHFALAAVCAESIDLTPQLVLQQLLRPTLLDQIQLYGLYVDPGTAAITWAVNARTGAVSEYSNYHFNSFARHGSRYLGARSDGLYYLDGDTDAGTNIIGRMAGGFLQFAGSRFSSLDAIYLGLHASGDVIIKVETGDQKTYTYKVAVQSRQTTKVRTGKGMRARYFTYELISTGPDFDLDSIEFVPVAAQRRV